VTRLTENSLLTSEQSQALYRAMLQDTFQAVAESGGDLLVNYPDPERVEDGTDPETQARAIAEETTVADDARFELQVGSDYAARVGNTLTHLLEEEGESSVAVVDGLAPLLTRKDIDSAAMRLRRHDTVLGPAQDGRVSFAGFCEPIDFTDAFDAPTIETLTEQSLRDGHDVDFLDAQTTVRTGSDLASVVCELNARQTAGRIVPEQTTTVLAEHQIGVVPTASGSGDSEIRLTTA